MVQTRSGKTSVTPEKRQKCVKKRLDQIKAKLVEINEAIGELDKIQTPTEDALLSWLRGPVSVSQSLNPYEPILRLRSIRDKLSRITVP